MLLKNIDPINEQSYVPPDDVFYLKEEERIDKEALLAKWKEKRSQGQCFL
jgi:hypothetical protein